MSRPAKPLACEFKSQKSKVKGLLARALGHKVPLHFGGKPSLIAYITCGDPDIATAKNIAIAAIDAGADILELGVPFSDPVADGPVIQRASQRALERGTTLADVLNLAREVREHNSETGLIIFSYLNPIFRFGFERFADAARQAHIDGVDQLAVDLGL